MSLLARLRSGTRECHERLEARMGLPAALTTTAEYQELLARLYGFYVPIEAEIAAPTWQHEWTALGIEDITLRSNKSAALAEDLQALGMTEAEITRLPRYSPADLPSLDTFSQVLGCAYVLEGATLGGQIIARHIEATFGNSLPSPALAFYRYYGTTVGAMWQRFSRMLDSFPDDETAVDAARQTFLGLERWLFE